MERLNENFTDSRPHTGQEAATLSGTAPISFRDVAHILRRRAPIALLTFAVTVAVAMLLTYRMTPTYQAQTKVNLDNVPPPALSGNVLSLLGGNHATAGDVEIAKIKSRNFLSEVIRRLNLDKITNPEDLNNRLDVSLASEGQILQIGVRWKSDAKMAAAIANTTALVYKEYVLQEGDRKTEVMQSRLRRALNKAKQENDVANQKLHAFMDRRGISDPGSFYAQRSKKTIDVRDSLEDLKRDLPLTEQRIELYTQQTQTIPPTIVTNFSQDKNGQIQGFKAQIVQYEAERKIMLVDFGEQSPEIGAIDAKIEATKLALKEVQGDAYSKGSIGMGRNPDYGTAVSNLINAKKELIQTKATIDALTKQLVGLESEQHQLAPESVRYQELMNQVAITRDAYQKANTALFQIPLDKMTNVPNISILEAARVPPFPVSPKPMLNLIMAIFGGAFLAVAVAIGAEYFAGGPRLGEVSLPTPGPTLYPALPAPSNLFGGLPAVGGVPVLARVPVANYTLPPHASGGLPTATIASASTEDAFREIGYILSHRDTDSPRVPVVLMAGTRTDDTTASVAAYLAATLVRDGMRITLVDGDRAEPRLHHVFGKPDAPGLTDVIAGRVSANEALHLGAGGSLRFLAAGEKDDPTPVTEEPLRRLFDDLAHESDTDLVVISGPSVWSARVVGAMERAADGMVLVASDAAVAPEESVARARRILSNGYQPRLLGVVVGEQKIPADRPAELPAATKGPDTA